MLGTIPWVRPINNILPSSAIVRRFREFAIDAAMRRMKQGAARKDVFYHLVRLFPLAWSSVHS
jgi:hypothetical protein